ncbi:MAG TPA: tetratricopeptide repeat protein [Smithellaceae bacterium]|nr:tetratricopeptide repeat protein [Smithellaceae bacterium]
MEKISIGNKMFNIGNKKYDHLILCILLSIAVLSVYWQVQNFEFLNFDDHAYVSGRPEVLSGLTIDNIAWSFSTTEAGFWHPMTWLSLMLDYELYGLNAGGYHWTNLLLHLASTLLLFSFFLKTTGALWKSGLVAVLFALHPLHIESVAWIAERKDVLSGFFGMLTMVTYTYYLGRPCLNRYFSVLFVFLLGLMSKPMLVTLPFVLLLLDFWPLKRLNFDNEHDGRHYSVSKKIKKIGLEKVPLLALSLIFSLLTYMAERDVGALSETGALPMIDRLINALVAYVVYLYKMIYPFDLAIFYPHPVAWPLWKGLLCSLLLVMITVMVFIHLKKRPYLFVGWFWYIGTLIPVIGLVQVGAHAFADRYTYIPLIGIFVVCVWGIADLAMHWQLRKESIIIVASLYILFIASVTHVQLGYWQTNEKLFRHAIEVTDNNFIAHGSLALALVANKQYDEANDHFKEALRIRPDYAPTYQFWGLSMLRQGKRDEAIQLFYRALEINPDFLEVRYRLIEILPEAKRFSETADQFRAILNKKPEDCPTRSKYAIMLVNNGQSKEAMVEFKKVVQLCPTYAGSRNNLGVILYRQGQLDEAIEHFREAIRLQPKFANAHHFLGRALQQKGMITAGQVHLLKAAEINPDYGAKNH